MSFLHDSYICDVFSTQMMSGALEDEHLDRISSRLDQEDMFCLGIELWIPKNSIQDTFIKYCSDPERAIMEIRKTLL